MPRGPNETRKWEKNRRDRLNGAFTELSKLFPSYDPSITISKIDILQTATTLIKDLDEKVKKLLSSSNNNKERANIIKKLQDRVKKLRTRNEQLANLLKDAGIRLPSECGMVKKFQPPHSLSNKFTPEQAALLQKKELEKENITTNRAIPKKKKVTVAPKHKKVLLTSKAKRLVQKRKQNKTNKVPVSKCLIVFSQPTNVNPYYIISNTPTNNVLKNTTNSTVLTNSTFFTTPLVSSNIKPTVLPTNPLVSTLGPGTIILANGTCLPVLQPSQTILPTPTLIANPSVQNQKSTLIVISKSSEVQTTKSVSSAISSVSKKNCSVAPTKNLIPLKPKMCLTRTTQVNKVPIPALTSKYNNYVLVKDELLSNKKNVASKTSNITVGKSSRGETKKTSKDTIKSGIKRKAPVVADIVSVVNKKTKVVIQQNEQDKQNTTNKDIPSEKNTVTEVKPQEKASVDSISEDLASSIITRNEERVCSLDPQASLEATSKDTSLIGDNSEPVTDKCVNFTNTPEKECSAADTSSIKEPGKPEESLKLLDAVENVTKLVSVDSNNLESSTTVTLTNTSIVTSESQELKALELNLSHSELSNDIFASLQVPPGCQNPESSSPTAAFLLAFPLVSSGVKVTEVIGEENSESQRGTPNLLQIGAIIDGGNKSAVCQNQSDSLTPSLLTLDNFSFLYEKCNKDIEFYSSSYQANVNSSLTTSVTISTTNSETICTTVNSNTSNQLTSFTSDTTASDVKHQNVIPSVKPEETKTNNINICSKSRADTSTNVQSNLMSSDNYQNNKTEISNNEINKSKHSYSSFEGVPKYPVVECSERKAEHKVPTTYSQHVIKGSVINKSSDNCQNSKTQPYQLTSIYNSYSNYPNKEKSSVSLSHTPLKQDFNYHKQVSYNILSAPSYQQHFSDINNYNLNTKMSSNNVNNPKDNAPKKCEPQADIYHPTNNFVNNSNYHLHTNKKTFDDNIPCIKYQGATRPQEVKQQRSDQHHNVLQICQYPTNSNYSNVNRPHQTTEAKPQQCQNYLSINKNIYKEENSNVAKNNMDQKQLPHSVSYNLSNPTNGQNEEHKQTCEERKQITFPASNYQQQVGAQQSSNPPNNYHLSNINYQNKPNENKEQNITFVSHRTSNDASTRKSIETVGYSVTNIEYEKSNVHQNISYSKNASHNNYFLNRPNKADDNHNTDHQSHLPQSYPEKQNKTNVSSTDHKNVSRHNVQNYQMPSAVSNYPTSTKSKETDDSIRFNHAAQSYPSVNYHNHNIKPSSQNYLPTSVNYNKNKQEIDHNKDISYNSNIDPKVINSSSYRPVVPPIDKNYTPLYTPSNTNCTFTNNHAYVTNFNQQYYKSVGSSVSRPENKNYYALNYENYAGYRKSELSSATNYCAESNNYNNSNSNNKDKYLINTNNNSTPVSKTTNNNSKGGSTQNKTVNWMTTPADNSTMSYKPDYLLPSFSKEGEFGHNIHSNNPTSINFVPSSTYFNTASRYTTSEINSSVETNSKKTVPSIDLPTLHHQRDTVEENQFSWSPSKLPQYLDTTHSYVSSTLPTLVGDLALNTVTPFLESKSSTTKSNPKKAGSNSYENQQQPNFLSVSQLVDHTNKEPAQRTTTRRNSGSRSKNNSTTKTKRLNANATKQEVKEQLVPSKNVETKTHSQAPPNKAAGGSYNLNENIFSDQKNSSTSSRNVGNIKNVPSSYSAEALIGPQAGSTTSSNKKQQHSTISSTSKSIIPNFLTENLISYFPPVDIAAENNYMQQNHQNYQPNTFSHTNFASTFPNTTVYSTASFIPSVSTITTTYLPGNNFMQHDVNTPEFLPDNLNLFTTANASNNKEKCYKSTSTSSYSRSAGNKDDNINKSSNTANNNSCASNPKKSTTKKRSSTTTTTNDAVLPNFDFPFLTVPAAINSPILPDDFHAHAGLFPPPTAPYACKNPLYPKQNSDLTSAALLPHPLPPPIAAPSRSSGIQLHAMDVTPCINTVGGGSTLANFNLSTIFPEINKGPLPEIFPSEPSRIKEHSISKNFPSVSSVQVPFSNKPTFSFSTYSS